MSFFIIRSGYFGFEFTFKLVWILIAIAAIIYDWRKNKRRDYLWVFLIASFLYIGAEIGMYFSGARVFTYRAIFGIDVSSLVWLTIPIQAIADVPVVAVICLFIGDRLMNKETRKEGIIFFVIYMLGKNVTIYSVLLGLGYNFTNINVGDLNIYSRRDVFDLFTIISIAGLLLLTIIWFIFTNKEARKRALFMFLMMIAFMSMWSLGEWLAGQRWIEVGTHPTFNLASPALQFGVFIYDIIVEMGLFSLSFLAIQYLLKLIKIRKKHENSIQHEV